ncbi:hypothetical protein HNR09_001115 [Nesterenkonia xinjiangensis]|uniref:Uncharacterized protein n=1 Tax=Nesterenkonia xinjiangensis TaxID=225327 RepID=A0A7Z0K8J3_9MICC|nr:hypothetical protein [Nesterenkonia xinjiangensis]
MSATVTVNRAAARASPPAAALHPVGVSVL